MLTVSIQPFACKRIAVLVAALLGVTSALCFGDPIFMNVRSTPYDRQMSRVAPVLTAAQTAAEADLPVAVVNRWIQELRTIPYGFSQEWKTPDEVEIGAPADCKAKAVSLYHRMRQHGATNLRLIIGKRTPASASTHAWLLWEINGETLVLDPTINWSACRTADVDEGSYVPYYGYAGGDKYAAATALLVARN